MTTYDDFREGYAEADDGVRLHYVAHGDPNGHLVLFVHGFPDFSYGWRHQMVALGDKGFLCVAPDMTGYAASDKPEGVKRYRAKYLIEDVRVFAEAFSRGKPFTLVGHDFGGALSWGFALKYPDLIDRLVIINAQHPGIYDREMRTNAAQAETSQYMHEIAADDAEAAYSADNFARLGASFDDARARGALTDDDIARYKAAWGEPGALTGMFNWYRALKVRPPADPAKASETVSERAYDPTAMTIHVPTLVVWGMDDHAILPVFVDALPEFVPDLRVRRVPEGSHWVLQEFPDIVTAEILGFLTGEGGEAQRA